MKSSFDLEYAHHLGYKDGREYGHKHPHRSFERGKSRRDDAYFLGLETGMEVSQKLGLDMRCHVRWDNPSFDDDNECRCKSTHVAFFLEHIIPLCSRHAKTDHGTTNKQWSVIPIGWL